jgi:hypothetical protein
VTDLIDLCKLFLAGRYPAIAARPHFLITEGRILLGCLVGRLTFWVRAFPKHFHMVPSQRYPHWPSADRARRDRQGARAVSGVILFIALAVVMYFLLWSDTDNDNSP